MAARAGVWLFLPRGTPPAFRAAFLARIGFLSFELAGVSVYPATSGGLRAAFLDGYESLANDVQAAALAALKEIQP